MCIRDRYINETEDHKVKLRAVRKGTLEPYEMCQRRPLGRGAYGEIYLCKHKVTGKFFALKKIKTAKMTDIKLTNLLLGEIRIMLEMNSSPYTIGLEDYFVFENDLCLVLEYCDGGDLFSFIKLLSKKGRCLNYKDLQMVAWNVGLGLNEMHNRKIMHRDVKPSNILVVKETSEDGAVIQDKIATVKLCDYGLSKKVKEWQELDGTTILGTYEYFAPELYELMDRRFLGEQIHFKYDYKIDVWSYGILLYFILYGNTPLDPPGSKYLVMKKRKILYPKVANVPELYFRFVKRALTYEVAKRPTFSELLRDPFFYDFIFKERRNGYSYEKGKVVSTQDNVAIHECTIENETYALKVIETSTVDMKKIQGEVVTLIELKDCENIVQLYDYFSIDSTIHLILDYFKDGDLETYVHIREEAKSPLSYDEQLFVAYCVAKALVGVHSYNLMHRRVSPRSVFVKLDSDGTIKDVVLGDFSCSWTCTGEIDPVHLPSIYSSPELTFAESRTHGSKTDIWSYGMLLYFLVFGIHPNEHPGNENIAKIMKTGSLSYDNTKANASKELVKLMVGCVKVNAIARPTSLLVLKNSLFEKYSQ
eukprot:TRINITY_DN1971_c0_g1_i7.p1 TRINITY_DN1971_c0_g1~~TRINITY_DN1971_c0_g1_i7.p1  ORF type:complete len:590 (+),score=110.04 TRINITY_DN1971_c0_g1_i7:80-1849(+)